MYKNFVAWFVTGKNMEQKQMLIRMRMAKETKTSL